MAQSSKTLVCKSHFFKTVALVLLASLAACSGSSKSPLPAGFVDLGETFAEEGLSLAVDLRYLGSDNFVGEPIDGYQANRVIITEPAANALLDAARYLAVQGIGLKVFDAYRPQQAVDHFVRWANDLDATEMKSRYYPNVDKANLFSDGYIAARSGHSRGSTIDLTLVEIDSEKELDMGSGWDFFDPLSWPSSQAVSADQFRNRQRLREAMIAAGFRPLAEEWWHFGLIDEPYPETFFNFPVR